MEPLSQQLSELSAQAKTAEDRVAKAQSEAKEQFEQLHEQARRETEAALAKVDEGISRASEGTKTHFTELKAKADADLQRMRENASERTRTFEAWQANNYANDKAADARAAIGYAIAAIKIAEVATLDAVEASGRAEIKAEQAQPIEV